MQIAATIFESASSMITFWQIMFKIILINMIDRDICLIKNQKHVFIQSPPYSDFCAFRYGKEKYASLFLSSTVCIILKKIQIKSFLIWVVFPCSFGDKTETNEPSNAVMRFNGLSNITSINRVNRKAAFLGTELSVQIQNEVNCDNETCLDKAKDTIQRYCVYMLLIFLFWEMRS